MILLEYHSFCFHTTVEQTDEAHLYGYRSCTHTFGTEAVARNVLDGWVPYFILQWSNWAMMDCSDTSLCACLTLAHYYPRSDHGLLLVSLRNLMHTLQHRDYRHLSLFHYQRKYIQATSADFITFSQPNFHSMFNKVHYRRHLFTVH